MYRFFQSEVILNLRCCLYQIFKRNREATVLFCFCASLDSSSFSQRMAVWDNPMVSAIHVVFEGALAGTQRAPVRAATVLLGYL